MGIFEVVVIVLIFAVIMIEITAYPLILNSHTYFNAAKCSANPTQQNCGTPTGITCFRINSTIFDFTCIHFWIRNNNLYLQKVYIPNLSN